MRLWYSIAKRLARLNPRPRVVRRMGALFLLDPRDWLDLRLIAGQPFETRQLDRFAALCREAGVTRFFDCGANFGLYSVLLPGRVPGLREGGAFEPVPTTRWRLVANLGLNGLTGQVRVHPIALSDRAGEAEIALDPGSSGVAAIAPTDAERAHRGFSQSVAVETARLDDLVSLSGERLALKIDVEGHEGAALRGMERLLRSNHCTLQVEVRKRNREAVVDYMEGLGYRLLELIDEDLYFQPVDARSGT